MLVLESGYMGVIMLKNIILKILLNAAIILILSFFLIGAYTTGGERNPEAAAAIEASAE